jgi:hypothetical protein
MHAAPSWRGSVGRRVGLVELDGRRSQRHRRSRRPRGIWTRRNSLSGFAAESLACREIEGALADFVVVHHDQVGGGARLLECLRDDERDRLVIMLDLGSAEKLSDVPLSPLPSLPAFSAVTIAITPGAAFAVGRSMARSRPLAIAAPTT